MFHPSSQQWSFTRAASLVPTNSRNRRWELGLNCGYLALTALACAAWGPSSTTPTCKVFCRNCAPTCFVKYRLQCEVVHIYIYIVLQVHGKALFRNPAKAAEWQEGFLPQLAWQYWYERHLELFLLWSQRRITETSCVLGVWENLQTRFCFVRLDLALSAHMILLHVRKAFLFGSDCRFHSFTQLSTSLNHGH